MAQNQKKSFNEIFEQLTQHSSKSAVYFFTKEELTKLVFDVAFSAVLDSEYLKAIEEEYLKLNKQD